MVFALTLYIVKLLFWVFLTTRQNITYLQSDLLIHNSICALLKNNNLSYISTNTTIFLSCESNSSVSLSELLSSQKKFLLTNIIIITRLIVFVITVFTIKYVFFMLMVLCFFQQVLLVLSRVIVSYVFLFNAYFSFKKNKCRGRDPSLQQENLKKMQKMQKGEPCVYHSEQGGAGVCWDLFYGGCTPFACH